MRRCSHLFLLLLLPAMLVTTGCGDDSPTSPAGGGEFSLSEHFTPEEAVVTEGDTESSLRMVGIGFTTGSANLTADSLPVLEKFRKVFREWPNATYSVEGHTDSRGSSSYNLRLSEDRALSVQSYLVDEVDGPSAAMNTVGYGEQRPLESNDTAIGRAVNRRIEIIITHEK